MSDQKALIPLFVPPLATMLAHAERQKGSALTPAEIEAIRDQSPCIMMELSDAQKMAESRGFVDVNPDNCWADWHRLRVQMTGRGYLPKIVLCVPGGDDLRARCEPILEDQRIEHEFRAHDAHMTRAFRASSVTWPGFTSKDFERIENHLTVLYVLSENYVAAAAPSVSCRFLEIGNRLLEAGGIAIKCESSGISHPADRWTKFMTNAKGAPDERFNALFHAYVAYPIGSKADLYTCGMHLLGAPDLIISQARARQSGTDDKTLVAMVAELFRVFANYFLAECPIGKFVSGHTFSIDRHAHRHRVVWEPCTGHAEDSFFFNPFGRWRFTEP